jgi:hypothetical protein
MCGGRNEQRIVGVRGRYYISLRAGFAGRINLAVGSETDRYLSIFLQIGGRALAWSLRLVPRRNRFAFAIWAARLLQPVIRRTRAFADRQRLLTDSIRETSLDLVLMMLTRHNTYFDPQLTIVGADLLPRGTGPSRATLLVSPHTMLSVLIARHLHDAGVAATLIVVERGMKIPGTGVTARVLLPTRTLFVTVREVFSAGGTVCSMIDRGDVERRNAGVTTVRGDFQISTALLDVALKQGAQILFFTAMLDENWNVVMTIAEPPRTATTTTADLIASFGAFLDTHVHCRTSV